MEGQKKSRSEPFPSILKKPRRREQVDRARSLLDRSHELRGDAGAAGAAGAAEASGGGGGGGGGKDEPPLAQGCTPLMYACQQGDYKALIDILNSDSRAIGRRDRGLRCALHYCAEGGAGGAARVACADRLLMAQPALAGARDADGLTPLHLAVIQGNVPLVQLLLAAGADVRAADNEHHTVVHWATVCGEVGALRAVLAAGADVATPDQHGGYPLHYAAQMCGAPSSVDHQGRGTALEVLRALVREGGARADVRDADGRAPLLWAASAGSAPALLALVKAGARVDDADRDGLTALHCAASRGHTECIETLLSLCGAATDAADSNGCTALHYAVTLGHADATALLLQHGADAHRQDRKGRSPAHCAAAKGQLETVRMLGARGANLWLRNSKGDLPLHEAVGSGRRDLVKWLLDGRPSQVNATNHDGRTPLHVAASTDNADLCRVLLDRGADINALARSSRNEPLTPLDCATSRGYRTTAKYLQMHGGLPASKLSNTQIIVDDGPISALPTRRVTSTRIDVRDRIRIEKREVLEVPGFTSLEGRRRHKGQVSSNSSDRSSGEDMRYANRRSKERQDGENDHPVRRRRLEHSQKSFSDGYDTDNGRDRRKHKHSGIDEKISKGHMNKARSRSEPGSESNGRSKSSYRERHRQYSESSGSERKRDKKRYRKHRKRSKRKSSSSSSGSTSESSERRSTKKKGKKTSIHIEDDENKQTVNIVNFKKPDKEGLLDDDQRSKSENGKDDVTSTKGKRQSGTETDTTSLKASTIITEAQIHANRDPDLPEKADVTVTVDSSNNISVETSTMKVTQQVKEVDGTTPQDVTLKENDEKPEIDGSSANIVQDKETSIVNKEVNEEAEFIEKESIASNMAEPMQNKTEMLEVNKTSEIESKKEPDTKSEQNDNENSNIELEKDISQTARKRSFEVLTSPDQVQKPNTLTEESLEHGKIPGKNMELTGNKESLDENKNEPENTNISTFPSLVSFAKVESTDVKGNQHLMGETINHELLSNQGTLDDVPLIKENSTNDGKDLNSARREYASTTQSSGDMTQSAEIGNGTDRGLVAVVDSNATDTDRGRAVQQVIMGSSQDETLIPTHESPNRVRKSSKDSQKSSRKSSLYETESYKVLSDITSANENTVGILKKSREHINEMNDDKESDALAKDQSYSRVGSVSDNEMYGASEANGRRKRFRKKIRDKSRAILRSKSENSERGYESSGLMDSGFEPSPRVVQRTRIMSPRLSAYYQQRNASGKYSGKSDSRIPVRKPGDKYAVDMKSVTQRIQTNMRRYYCERKIFQHLLELKRLQIRSSKANEAVFVKRAIDEYNGSSLASVGNGPYSGPDFTFSSFEKFLYDSLRKLQKSGKRHLDKLPEKPIEFDYGERELYKMSAIPDNPCLCTTKTHRCFHAVHAYTGVPCSAYIPQKLNHHTMPKPCNSKASFLPKIDSKSGRSQAHAHPHAHPHVRLEVSHGTERQLIALPADKLEKNKRYYVTFTVKGSNPASDNDNPSKSNDSTQRNTKSV